MKKYIKDFMRERRYLYLILLIVIISFFLNIFDFSDSSHYSIEILKGIPMAIVVIEKEKDSKGFLYKLGYILIFSTLFLDILLMTFGLII